MLSAVGRKRRRKESQTFFPSRWVPILIGLSFFVGGCSTTLSSFQNSSSLHPSTLIGDNPSFESSTDSVFEFERQALKQLVLDFLGSHTLLGSQVLAAIKQNPNLSVHDFLVEMLNDKNWVTRLQAASAIDLVHDERGWEALQTLLRDPDIVVKLRVERILSSWKPSFTRHTAQTIEEEDIGGMSMEKSNAPRMIIERAEGFFLQENYSLAIGEYHHFLALYPGHLLAPFAQFKLGESYFNTALSVDRDPTPIQNALAVFQAFLNDYPESHYRSRLGARIRECQNWLARVDLLVGQFYFNKEKYEAAAHRFEKIVGNELDLEVLPDALFGLAQAYMGIGKETWPQARNVLIQLTEKYPNDSHKEESEKLLVSLNESLSPHIFARIFPSTTNDSFIHEVAKTGSFGLKGFPQQEGFHNKNPSSLSLIPVNGTSGNGPSQKTAHLRNNTQDCLASTTDTPRFTTLSLKTEFGCDLRLQQDDIRVNFSYGRQNWQSSYVRNLNDLLTYLERENNLTRSTGNIDLLGKSLQAEFELSYSYPTAPSPNTAEGSDGFATQIGLKGNHDRINYWGTYQNLGKEFTKNWDANPEDRNGQEETKVGAEFDWGFLKPLVQLKRLSYNVENNSDESQSLSNEGKVSLGLSVPQWPILTLTYGRKQEETRNRSKGTLENESTTEELKASLWYQGSTWETLMLSSYSLTRDQMDRDSNSVVSYNYLGTSFWPIDGFSINPSLEFMQIKYNPSQYLTETTTANLGFKYSFFEELLKFSFHGYGSKTRDSDGYVDTQDLGVSFAVENDVEGILNLPHSNQKIILKMDHYSYRDLIYSTANSSVSSVLLLFKISP